MIKTILLFIIIISVSHVASAADLAVTKSASSTTVSPGEQVTYTITVINNGPEAASNVKISDKIYRASYVSHNVSNGSCKAGGTLICNLGTLEPGDTETVELMVTINNAKSNTKFSNTVSVVSPNDPNRRNNKSSVKMKIR